MPSPARRSRSIPARCCHNLRRSPGAPGTYKMIPLFSSLYAALLQFAVGSLFAALICDAGGKVTPGFLRQAAVGALVGALLAWLMTGRGAAGEGPSALGPLLPAAADPGLPVPGR